MTRSDSKRLTGHELSDDAKQRTKLLYALLGVSMAIAGAACLLLVVSLAAVPPSLVLARSLPAFALLAIWGLLWRAARRGRHRAAAVALITSWYAAYVGVILNASIQLPVAGLMAILIVVISGVLLGGRGSAYATAAIGVAAIAQVALDRTGVMSPDMDWKQTGYGTSDLAIQTVFAIGIAGILWHALREPRRPLPEIIKAAGGSLAQERVRTKDLTLRESEVARLVAEGLSNKEIGDALFVSDRTVQTQ